MFADVSAAITKPVIPKIICLILALLLIWQILSELTAIFSLNKMMNAASHQLKEKKRDVSYPHSLNNLNTSLFGDFVPPNLTTTDVKPSMLNFNIVGIMFDEKEDASHVVVDAEGIQQTFRVGDALPGGAVVKRITPEGILILRNGSLESLSLPKKALIFQPLSSPLGGLN